MSLLLTTLAGNRTTLRISVFGLSLTHLAALLPCCRYICAARHFYVCLHRSISQLKFLLKFKFIIVSQEAEERRTFAVNYMKEIAHTAILTERKKKKLNEILPEVFCKMVHSAVIDLNDLDTFMKNSFERIKNK